MIQTLGKFEQVFTVEFSSTYIYVDTKDINYGVSSSQPLLLHFLTVQRQAKKASKLSSCNACRRCTIAMLCVNAYGIAVDKV